MSIMKTYKSTEIHMQDKDRYKGREKAAVSNRNTIPATK
jgi:hypothetical protein